MPLEQIRCEDIISDPRRTGEAAFEIDQLVDSVRRFGVLRPVLLRPTADGYVIVHGERRYRAARLAGLKAIPAWLVEEVASEDAVFA